MTAAIAQKKVDALSVFELRCWAKARLVAEGMAELPDAVDELQALAEASGLVERHGPDFVQIIMSDAFRRGSL